MLITSLKQYIFNGRLDNFAPSLHSSWGLGAAVCFRLGEPLLANFWLTKAVVNFCSLFLHEFAAHCMLGLRG